MTADADGALLTVRGLTKHFYRGLWPRKETIVAVDGIDFEVGPGESVGLVGESGSGKTTTARSILRLVDPTAGEVQFDGIRVDETPRAKVRRLYRNMQMVFQDPNSSLNPRMSVREIVTEPIKLHLQMTKDEREERANEIMSMVGLRGFHLDRYPGSVEWRPTPTRRRRPCHRHPPQAGFPRRAHVVARRVGAWPGDAAPRRSPAGAEHVLRADQPRSRRRSPADPEGPCDVQGQDRRGGADRASIRRRPGRLHEAPTRRNPVYGRLPSTAS